MTRFEMLADHMEVISQVAAWHWAEWARNQPDETPEGVLERLSLRINRERLPLAYVALEGSEPVGTASLVAHDMETHPELTPWLAGVFVAPAWRRRGIGSALVNLIREKSAQLGFDIIYLYSRSAVRLYRELGWEKFSKERYLGKTVDIMRYTHRSSR